MRLVLGDEGYEGQFNQSPAPAGGQRLSRDLFCKYKRVSGDIIELTNKFGNKSIIKLGLCWSFVSVDLAASEKQTADYTAFSVWAVTPTYDMILLNVVNERMGEPKIIEKAIALHAFTGYNGRKHLAFVVEDNGLGLPIAQSMAKHGLPVMQVHIHRTDKLVRSATAVIRANAGGIYLPEDGPEYPWKEPWLRQHERFPGDEHDDMVDATSLAASALFDMGIAGLHGGEFLKHSKKSAHEVMEPQKQELPAATKQNKRLFGT
jgi:predicted phage terminase large subunit-like protein